jgi:uncharacterized protein (UPF0332 family)
MRRSIRPVDLGHFNSAIGSRKRRGREEAAFPASTAKALLHLTKARQSLAKARAMLGIALADKAGRVVYLAAFHAPQALIYERTGRTPKTHQSVRAQFGAPARTEPHIDISLQRFLTDGYDLKSVADYAIGPGAVVSTDDANQAIETAGRFVDCIHAMLSVQ